MVRIPVLFWRKIKRKLSHTDPLVRIEGCKRLAHQDPEISIPLLIKCFEDPNKDVFHAAIEILREFPEEITLFHLIPHLTSPLGEYQQIILHAFHLINPKRFESDIHLIVKMLSLTEKKQLYDHILTELPQDRSARAAYLIIILGDIGFESAAANIVQYLTKLANDQMQANPDAKFSWNRYYDQQYFRMIVKTAAKIIGHLNPDRELLGSILSNRNRHFRLVTLETIHDLPLIPKYFPFFVDLLEDPDIETMIRGIESLGNMKDKSAIIPLVKKINPLQPEIAGKIIWALTQIDPSRFEGISARDWPEIFHNLTEMERKQIIPNLVDNLLHWNDRVRLSAEEILPRIIDVNFLANLEKILNQPEKAVKSRAIRILRRWAHPSCIPLLLRQFFFTDWTMHEELVTALQDIAPERFNGMVKSQILKSLNEDEYSELKTIYGSKPLQLLTEDQLYLIALIPDRENASILIILVDHANFNIAAAAIQTLGEMRLNQAVPILLDRIIRFERSMKVSIITALSHIGDQRAIPALIESFESSDQFLNRAIITGLKQFLRQDLIVNLSHYSDTKNYMIRNGVAFTIGALGLEECVPSLIKLSKDPTDLIKRNAIYALGEIHNEICEDYLIKMYKIADDSIKPTILVSLGKFPHGRNSEVFLDALNNQSENVRNIAAIQLGLIGDPIALPMIRSLAADPKAAFRLNAIEALAKIGTSKAIQGLLVILATAEKETRSMIFTKLNQLLHYSPMHTVINIHHFYHKQNHPIPEEFNVYELLPSITCYRLDLFKSLEPGALIEEWLQFQTPLILQILEAYGPVVQRYLERILDHLPDSWPREPYQPIQTILNRVQHANYYQLNSGFRIML